MPTKWSNYIEAGYDESDALDLDAGRWMYDDERQTQVYVLLREAS